MKKCPYCAEEIQDAAIVCRYCGKDIEIQKSIVSSPIAETENSTISQKTPRSNKQKKHLVKRTSMNDRPCLPKFMNMLFSFKGRIGRMTYWGAGFILLIWELIGFFILDFININVNDNYLADFILFIIGAIFIVTIVWSSLAITIKRLHDRDSSGWWMLILLVPLIGWWTGIELAFIGGTKGPNKFGEKTESNIVVERIGIIGGIIAVIVFAIIFNLPTQIQTLSPTIPPTLVPKPITTVRVVTTAAPACLKWDKVTPQMEGQVVCVYGIVVDHKENYQIEQTYFYFGKPDQFFFTSTYRWDKLMEGACLTATGKIQLNTYKTPFIKIEDSLNQCDSSLANSPSIQPPAPNATTSVIVPSESNCVQWSNISIRMVGQRVCVYGKVLTQITNTNTNKTYFYFGEKNQFYIVSTSSWAVQMEGVCFQTYGLVQSNNNIPYIQISNNLYQCATWMTP